MSLNFPLSRLFIIALAIVLFAGFSYTSVQADVTAQIGDFRVGASDVSADTAFDPGVTFVSRSIIGAPVQVNSVFSVGSQNSDGTVTVAEDVVLRTFSSLTRLRNLNRFTPSAVAGAGVERIGIAQWNFDLSVIDTFLAANPNESLQTLDLDLLTFNSDATSTTDVYLSYTLPSAGIALAGIDSTTPNAGPNNHATFFLPSRGATVGDVVGGTHQVLSLGAVNDLTLKHSVLALYNDGVREFNLTLASDSFLSARNIDILEGSGISFATVENSILLGDVNLDGTVNFLDISPFIAVLSSGTLQAEADCDENGVVNFLDISPFIAILSAG